MAEKTLYERLGGVFAIAAVVDRFSDEVVKDPIVGQGRRIRPSGVRVVRAISPRPSQR